MERTVSVEEKIRRAEEIYNRRRENETKNTTARVNVENKKNTTVLKKMRNQILVCVLVYLAFYYIVNNNLIFSEEFKNKVNEILSYEVNFSELYSQISNYLKDLKSNKTETNNETKDSTQENVDEQNNLQENIENTNNTENQNNLENLDIQENNQNTEGQENQENISMETSIQNSIGGANEENTNLEVAQELSEEDQMKKDAEEIKNSISFIKPVSGVITSAFGYRNPTVSTVSKYHTGLDIGANSGTDIISATDGKVILRSTEGDYGNHLKIEKNDVIIIYAHCSKLLVNEGEEVKQGQKIAEVGSTGNSTGPHLHFEIRKSGRYVNPQLILDI